MNKKDDKSDKKSDSFSNSAEIFEDLFKDATQTFEKPKVEKPKQEPPKRGSIPRSDQSRPLRAPKGFQASAKAPKKETQPRREEPKSRLPEKSARKTSIFKVGLLVLLLAVLAGAVVNYLGVFDVSSLSDLIGLGKKEPVAPALKKPAPKAQVASKPAEKKSAETVAPAKKEEAGVKKETPPRVETAKPTAPPEVPEQAAIKAPMPAQPVQVKQEKPAPVALPQQELPQKETPPIAVAQNAQATPPVSQPSPPPQAQSKAVKPEPLQQSVAQTKSSSVEPPPGPIESLVRYPYSIYLGSYQTIELAKKALSLYKELGSPVYWAKVKLGDKGVWYRVYAGYFKNEAEAKNFISSSQLKDAEVKMTKYALLVGLFPTRAEADQKLSIMFDLGFPAYIIPEPQVGRVRLCSGAFHTKEGADSALSELASKGIRASAVER